MLMMINTNRTKSYNPENLLLITPLNPNLLVIFLDKTNLEQMNHQVNPVKNPIMKYLPKIMQLKLLPQLQQ